MDGMGQLTPSNRRPPRGRYSVEVDDLYPP